MFGWLTKGFRQIGLASGDSWLVDTWGGQPVFAGERVNQQTAMGLAGVFAAVYKLSETVGSLPLKVYRTMPDDSRIEARQHRSWTMLHDKPNEFTTATAFWSTVVTQLALNGNAYLYKGRDDTGTVDSLWLLDPWLITIKQDGGTRWYEQLNTIPPRRYSTDEVCHIIGFSLDGTVGCSRIEYCRQTFGKSIARDCYEGTFYSGGSKTPGVIQYPGLLGPDGRKNLAESFAQKHGGSAQMHKPPILEEGATWSNTGMSLQDMQFVENAQLSLTEIAVLFDLPPGELGGMHGGSLEYATEELNQIRLTRACVPYVTRIQKALSTDPAILPWDVMFAEFTLDAIMRPDAKTRVEYWQAMKAMDVVTAEYIASRENLPPPPAPKPVPLATPPAAGGGNGAADPSGLLAMIGGQNA